jgi:hypothetical protein
MTLEPILVPIIPPYGSVSPRFIRRRWRHHFASRVRLRSGFLWGLLDAKITMVEGVESDHSETQRRLGRARQGQMCAITKLVHMHLRATSVHLVPSPAYPWVHISFCLTRRGPTGEVLQAACWPASCFALDVKLLLTVNHTSRIDAE